MMTKEKRRFLEWHLGRRRAKEILDALAAKTEELEGLGIKYKSLETATLAMGFKEALEGMIDGDDEEALAELLGDFREALDATDPVDGYVADLFGRPRDEGIRRET